MRRKMTRVIMTLFLAFMAINMLPAHAILPNQPPVALAGSGQMVEQTSHLGAEVTLDGTGSYDPDGDPLSYDWTWTGGSATGPTPTITCPLGITTVTLTVNDGEYSDTDTVEITVVDTLPPEITVSLSRDTLWPPNHKYRTIMATVTVADMCDPSPVVRLVSVTSNEPDNAKGVGDGNTINDIAEAAFGTGDFEFKLRAERAEEGVGRVYWVIYEAIDASGNVAQVSATVSVPVSK